MKDTFENKEVVVGNTVIRSGIRPLVCVPLMGEDDQLVMEHLEDILNEAKETRIDIVEFRADYYDELQDFKKVKDILAKVREALGDKVLLFTIRSPREGGVDREYSKTIEEINSFVIENKLADMVDVELASVGEKCALIDLAKMNQVKIIMSNHDFEKTPDREEIVNRLIRMQRLGADVAKIAVMPHSKEDLEVLLSATVDAHMKGTGAPIISMSMGEIGAQSRILGEVYGSAVTFGSVGQVSAPGQLQVRELNEMLDMIHNKTV
ncbi:MAG: type I 3-dehydroquinate dehydratase [Lachnospiraceae bacterium]|nr:type I 3-dehydroquinate dehydratase [Lachnospiraceae bacterium]